MYFNKNISSRICENLRNLRIRKRMSKLSQENFGDIPWFEKVLAGFWSRDAVVIETMSETSQLFGSK